MSSRRIVHKIASVLSVASRANFPLRACALSNPYYEQSRHLVHHAYLQLKDYTRRKDGCITQLSNAQVGRDAYIKMLTDQVADEKKILAMGDLENLLVLANSKTDTQLAISMLKRILAQIKAGITPRAVVIGRLTMSMFRVLHLLDEALESYRDPELTDVFGVGAATTLLDSLYDAGRYSEAIEVYETLRNRRKAASRPRHSAGHVPSIIFAAACYKVGTIEALSSLQRVIEENKQTGVTFCQHELCFSALLSIKHKQFDFAKECERLYPRHQWGFNEHAVRILRVLEEASFDELISLMDAVHQEFTGKVRSVIGSDLVKQLDQTIIKLKADSSTAELSKRLESSRNQLAAAKMFSMLTVEELLFRWVAKVAPSNNDISKVGRSSQTGFSTSTVNSVPQPAINRLHATSDSISHEQTHNRFIDRGRTDDSRPVRSSFRRPGSQERFKSPSGKYSQIDSAGSLENVRSAIERADGRELVWLLAAVRKELNLRRRSEAPSMQRISKLLTNLRDDTYRVTSNVEQLESAVKNLLGDANSDRPQDNT